MVKPLRSLYIDLNSFFASCEQQERPELRGKPIAVVPMLADTTSVIAASYEAKAFGVKTGVKVGDAKRMCPGLILVPAKHGPYIRYHHEVIAAVDTVMPVHGVCSIDEIACELTGSQQNVDRARELALEIKAVIAKRVGVALKASIGIAPNFLLAKIACDMQKPDGLTIIQEHELPQKLFTLKLQDIPGIGPRMERRLHTQGVFTMAQLMERSEGQTHALWGSLLGSRMHRLLLGDWTDLRRDQASKSIGHQHVLPPIERNPEGALLVAHKLVWKAAIRLRAENFLARRLSLTVKYLDQTKFHDEIKMPETDDTSYFLKAINRMFSKSSRSKRPMKVTIVFSDFVEETQHQLSFFDDAPKPGLYKTIDQINARFGKNTICAGSVHQTKSTAPTRIAFARIPGLDEIEAEA